MRDTALNMNDIYDQIQSGEIDLDQALNPGSYLHDVNPDDLTTQIMDSGFPNLDKDYLFLKENEGELIIVAGLPSMGKTGFMFQIASHVSKTHPVHVFSLEMSKQSVVRRLLSPIVGRPITAIQMGLVDRPSILRGLSELSKQQYFIDDRSGLTADEICDAARNRARKVETKLLVIDYLQIMDMPPGHSRALEIGVATKKLKALAKELKVPIIVGSQLNRQSVLRGGDMKPMLTDLKESGSIEADSDVVIAIHRVSRYTGLRVDEADILVLKNRNGKVGELPMKFWAAQTQFVDCLGSDDI